MKLRTKGLISMVSLNCSTPAQATIVSPRWNPLTAMEAFLISAPFLWLRSRFCLLRTCTLLPNMTVSESTSEEGSEKGDILALQRESFAQTSECITSGSNRSQHVGAPLLPVSLSRVTGRACFFHCLLITLLGSLQSLIFRGKESVCLFSSIHPPPFSLFFPGLLFFCCC